MAQSPGEQQIGPKSNTYFQGWQAISQLLYDGASWSGNERHCCFLNTREDRFADISAASGFDLLDDGRGMGLVDWDQDGDLDIWIANRSGPRIRFLRNESPKTGHFLAIKLTGKTCNRDGIGARLELHLAGQENRPLIRTLHAGQGYLGQSTKWVHFGLGQAGRIQKLVVRWPGGEAEEFKSLESDHRYELVQGSGAREWSAAKRSVNLIDKPFKSPPSSSQARIVLFNRQSMPDLQYSDFAGQPHRLSEYQGRPFLLNIWASWCKPCVKELSDFAENQDRLKAAGLEVVAFNFDNIGTDNEGGSQEARHLLKSINAPFATAQGTPLVADTLEMGLRFYFDKAGALPLPCSFLVDPSFRVAVIYFGPVSSEQLLSDVKILTKPPISWEKEITPLQGSWITPLYGAVPLKDSLPQSNGNVLQSQTQSASTPKEWIVFLLLFSIIIAFSVIIWCRIRR